jgi:ATP-dependent DNA helicase RecQ
VDLSFAGRLRDGDQRLTALETLSAGDPVRLKQLGEGWLISDHNDVTIGRLAKKFKPPEGATFVAGSVFAICTRYRSDAAEEFQAQLKRDQWSLVMPELIYQAWSSPVRV